MTWLPWLIATVMLVVFYHTLDHGVALDSLHQIANLCDVTWLAELSRPVSFLVTYPFRWLPVAWIAPSINLFTAACASLTLALLARSVALLPHDRTQDERERNPNKCAFLTIPNAWLPPVLAVVVCGLQLTFWEHAIAATGEMVDLLLFAYAVRCLLEYRISQKESWLVRFAFINGLAVANNWAMMLLLPAFLVALLWITGVFHSFTPTFLARFLRERTLKLGCPLLLLSCWLAGAAFFLIPPMVAAHSVENPVEFGAGLNFAARNYYLLLTAFPLRTGLLLSLTSIVPLAFIGVRWASLIVTNNRWDGMAVRGAFHIVHGFFLVMCLWGALDSPFSPRHLQTAFPCLPLYFLASLSTGYFCGSFLLAFGNRIEKFRRPPQPMARYLHCGSIAMMYLALIMAPVILVYKNFPEILKRQHDPLTAYFETLEHTLPFKGSVILSEQTLQLQYLETILIQHGEQGHFMLIDTGFLRRFPAYYKFLCEKYQDFLSKEQNGQLTWSSGMLSPWMEQLSKARTIYTLHPYAGTLGESFFTEQHGLFFQLRPYSSYEGEGQLLSPALIATNHAFWQTIQREQGPILFERLQPSSGDPRWERLLKAAHIHPQPDRSALLAAEYYSMTQNSWGVALQKAGMLAQASEFFQAALPLSAENMPAFMNLECNQALQAHQAIILDPDRRVEDEFSRSHDWEESLRRDGPTDSPNACYRFGLVCAGSKLNRQAIQNFKRAQELAPESAEPHLRLAELFLGLGENTNSLTEALRALEIPPLHPRALILQGLALVEMRKFYQAIPPLNEALDADANNTDARLARAVAYLNVDKLQAAEEDYHAVVKAAPTTYPAYYGLADIAYQKKDPASLIENCRLYLANAPSNAPEIGQVRTWLQDARLTAPTR